MINDDKLTAAAQELEECIINSLPEAQEHTFSQKFLNRMNRLIFKTDHPIPYHLAKGTILLLTVIIIVGLGLLLFSCSKECDHSFITVVSAEATCTEKGVKTSTCQQCHLSTSEPIATVAHSYDAGIETKAASCIEEGVITYTCIHCGDIQRESIAVVDHQYGEKTVTKEATCFQEGEISVTCRVCNAFKCVEKIPKTETHNYETQVLVQSTCIEKGSGEQVCTLCGHSIPISYDLVDHNYSTAVVTKKASCSTKGEKTYTCTVCNHTKTETIAKKDHTWNDVDCDTPASCTVCGYTQSKAQGHEFKLNYELGGGVNYLPVRAYICTRCGCNDYVYYGRHGDYDCAAIEKMGSRQIKELGFSATSCTGHGYAKLTRERSMALVENGGGQAMLEKLMEELVKELDIKCPDNAQYNAKIEVKYLNPSGLGDGSKFRLTIYYHQCPPEE